MIFFCAHICHQQPNFGEDERHEGGEETGEVAEKGKRLKENNKPEWIEIENRVREEEKNFLFVAWIKQFLDHKMPT